MSDRIDWAFAVRQLAIHNISPTIFSEIESRRVRFMAIMPDGHSVSRRFTQEEFAEHYRQARHRIADLFAPLTKDMRFKANKAAARESVRRLKAIGFFDDLSGAAR